MTVKLRVTPIPETQKLYHTDNGTRPKPAHVTRTVTPKSPVKVSRKYHANTTTAPKSRVTPPKPSVKGPQPSPPCHYRKQRFRKRYRQNIEDTQNGGQVTISIQKGPFPEELSQYTSCNENQEGLRITIPLRDEALFSKVAIMIGFVVNYLQMSSTDTLAIEKFRALSVSNLPTLSHRTLLP